MALSLLNQVTKDVRKTGTKMIVNAVPGWGKCLGKGTPILMFDGSIKAVEDVQEGDLLMGPDSIARKATGIHKGHGALYRVTPTKGMSFVANDKHILSLKYSGREGIINMTVTDFLAQSEQMRGRLKAWRTGVEFSEKSLPLDPYLLGAWLGDGSRKKPDITTPDKEVVDAMQEFADANNCQTKVVCQSGKAQTITIKRNSPKQTKNPFIEVLRDLKVYENKHVPQIYKTGSKAQRLEFLAGFLDADGYMAHNCFDLCLVNETLAEDIVFIARSVGLAAYLTPCEKTCYNSPTMARGLYYRVKISGDTDLIPNRIERRKAQPRKQVKNVLVTGIKVEAIGDGDFYGFEVDHDHLFLLGDFTVTHNTCFAAFADAPLFLLSAREDGFHKLKEQGIIPQDIPCFPTLLQRWETIRNIVRELKNEKHDYRTIVIDTLTGWYETLQEYVITNHFQGEPNKFNDYGAGQKFVPEPWKQLLNDLNDIADKGIRIIALCHCAVASFKDPQKGDYNRWQARFPEAIWQLTSAWGDMILFGDLDTTVDKKKAQGGSGRVVYTTKKATFDAKNRHNLPEMIPVGAEGGEVAWRRFTSAVAAAAKKRKVTPSQGEEGEDTQTTSDE